MPDEITQAESAGLRLVLGLLFGEECPCVGIGRSQRTSPRGLYGDLRGPVAPTEELLPCKQGDEGSNPSGSTKSI